MSHVILCREVTVGERDPRGSHEPSATGTPIVIDETGPHLQPDECLQATL
jgi:hypothetical protein